VNLFTIHLLGDAFSPTLIGWVSDRTNLQTGFFSAIVAVILSATILFYGMRFAPKQPPSLQGVAAAHETACCPSASLSILLRGASAFFWLLCGSRGWPS